MEHRVIEGVKLEDRPKGEHANSQTQIEKNQRTKKQVASCTYCKLTSVLGPMEHHVIEGVKLEDRPKAQKTSHSATGLREKQYRDGLVLAVSYWGRLRVAPYLGRLELAPCYKRLKVG
ncbi:hypothetical protein NDU88_000761 [Pleurodeles waltl]|uniref:Uncharacterized protein n=1 Tax=Pleurodeles waltl TaxID=8319 RepID=A0AAV7KMV4_PLEWA|nr:hypothetical protein NDU88_000761 [Pleurodeles waltl]